MRKKVTIEIGNIWSSEVIEKHRLEILNHGSERERTIMNELYCQFMFNRFLVSGMLSGGSGRTLTNEDVNREVERLLGKFFNVVNGMDGMKQEVAQ